MSKHYTAEPGGLLPGVGLQRSTLEEPTTYQAPEDTWLVRSGHRRDNQGPCPQFGDLVLDGQVKRAKADDIAATSPSSPSSSSSKHVERKPILGGGLVQEISLVFYNSKATKEDFPAPFCLLPDYKFVEWVVRNMALLGVGEWEAECEAMDVLWRTKEKMKEEEGEVVVVEERDEDRKDRAGGVEDEDENEDEDTCEIVREMKMRLDAINRRKMEKHEKRRKVLWIWKSAKKHHDEATPMEQLDLQPTKHAVKSSHMARIKACFRRK